ncbi:alpha-1,2-fucosyltransferase [Acutalibacter intestini]|uniref:alpha-1,2-fucosyltransferase n=1 Tax=Acutalibacter intestini TaxID=3093659 RepID=UPI002AC90C43|nr:alpha-1,2-fucosyltransferase [Acutalibacter sp. M00204]
MKIQLFDGGLANQIRYYFFVRYAQRQRPDDVWLYDDTIYFVEERHNGYELERIFGLKLNLVSQYYRREIWEKIVQNRRDGIILPQTLLDMGIPSVLFEGRVSLSQIKDQAEFSGKTIFAEGGHLGFHPEYIDLPYKNIYYHAEWASRKWFDAYAEENRQELQFPPLTDKRNLDYAGQMGNCYSVGIHVRRGDFQNIGWDLPAEVYKSACQKVVLEHPDAHFFVFSDDLEWCRANEKELGFDLSQKTTYVVGNRGKNSYIDMQLLSMCKGMIRNAESSFSQVAGWLNPNLEFEIKLKKA